MGDRFSKMNSESQQPPSPLGLEPMDRMLRALFEPIESGHQPDAGSLPSDHDISIPGYRLERLVGSGSGGAVYKAYRDGSDRPVAVKVLNPPSRQNDSRRFVDRALRELSTLADLHLPCLPRVLDFGQCKGRPYMVTDYIHGEPVDRYAEQFSLSLTDRVELLARVCDAVQSVHEQAVIHRDLKPSNVLIDSKGAPFILDFGLALLVRPAANPTATLTLEGAPVGTPAFMSPEQARGDRAAVSTRSDIYSLGAIGYVLLTGQTPHDTRTDLPELIRRVAQDPARDPRELSPMVPKQLAAVLARCCAADPARRYPSAADLAADLRRFLAGEPVEAALPSRWQRALRWSGRHPVLSTGIVCLVMIASAISAAYGAVWYLNNQPARMEVSTDLTTANLRSLSNKVLGTWRAATIRVAEVIDRPRRLGGGRIVVLGASECANWPERLQDQLLFFDARDPRQPIWTSGRGPESISAPGLEAEKSDTFKLSAAVLADVFPEPPGNSSVPEIIAVHRHHSSAQCAIRVYDLSGSVRYEVWHFGHVDSVYWLQESSQIVLAGVSNTHSYERMGETAPPAAPYGLPNKYPYCVGAVRPVDGLVDGFINPPPGIQASVAKSCTWHKLLTPWSAHSLFNKIVLNVPKFVIEDDPGVSVALSLVDPTSPQRLAQTIYLTLRSDGSPAGAAVFSGDFRAAHPELPLDNFRLVDSHRILEDVKGEP